MKQSLMTLFLLILVGMFSVGCEDSDTTKPSDGDQIDNPGDDNPGTGSDAPGKGDSCSATQKCANGLACVKGTGDNGVCAVVCNETNKATKCTEAGKTQCVEKTLIGAAPGTMVCGESGGGAVCGNGVVDPGETCDNKASGADERCMSEATCKLKAPDKCTKATYKGSAETCDVTCTVEPLTVNAIQADGCCPEGAQPGEDPDCNLGEVGDACQMKEDCSEGLDCRGSEGQEKICVRPCDTSDSISGTKDPKCRADETCEEYGNGLGFWCHKENCEEDADCGGSLNSVCLPVQDGSKTVDTCNYRHRLDYKEKISCTDDTACGVDGLCYHGMCVGKDCNDNNVCKPDSQCIRFDDAPEALCFPICNNASECPSISDYTCHISGQIKSCLPNIIPQVKNFGAACNNDADCRPEGTEDGLCENGVCVTGCSLSGQCPTGVSATCVEVTPTPDHNEKEKRCLPNCSAGSSDCSTGSGRACVQLKKVRDNSQTQDVCVADFIPTTNFKKSCTTDSDCPDQGLCFSDIESGGQTYPGLKTCYTYPSNRNPATCDTSKGAELANDKCISACTKDSDCNGSDSSLLCHDRYKICAKASRSTVTNMGGACSANNECGADGVCKVNATLYPDGFCSAVCDNETLFCPSDSACDRDPDAIPQQPTGICYKKCDTSADCGREGYLCEIQSRLCKPAALIGTPCTQDSECDAMRSEACNLAYNNNSVDMTSGICMPKAEGSGVIGDPCSSTADCSGGFGGYCIAQQLGPGGTPVHKNGACSKMCGQDSDCGSGAACMQNTCYKICSDDNDCRSADYWTCQGVGSAQKVCFG